VKTVEWKQPITEPQRTEISFLCRQVPFNAGTWSLNLRPPDPRDCKCFPLKTGFFKVRVPFKTSFTAHWSLRLQQYRHSLCVTSWTDSSLGYHSTHSDLLRPGCSTVRTPLGTFSARVQTGPAAHPASYTVGTESLPEVKRPGRSVEHPSPSRAEVRRRVPSWQVIGRNLLNG